MGAVPPLSARCSACLLGPQRWGLVQRALAQAPWNALLAARRISTPHALPESNYLNQPRPSPPRPAGIEWSGWRMGSATR